MSARTGRVDAESVDAEDIVEDFFWAVMLTGIISVLLLGLFLLRKYIQWGIDCPSVNRIDGKTVIITEERYQGNPRLAAWQKIDWEGPIILPYVDKPCNVLYKETKPPLRSHLYLFPKKECMTFQEIVLCGGNSGIGKSTAMELAKRGARVIIACRDRVKGEAVARNIKKKTMNPNIFSMPLDLASLHSVREFVEEFNRSEPQLHILINNAAYLGPRATTDDHIERSFGVNYLGHFLLTKLLVDKLHKNAPSRIINVVSDSYQRGKLDFQDIAMHHSYGIYRAYARSKLSQAIHTVEMHRRLFRECIWTFGVHPGSCNTELLRNWPGLTGQFLRVMGRILFKTPEQGCQSIVYCAVADKVREQAGMLFSNCNATQFAKMVRDYQQSRKLWNVSLHLIGCDDEIEPEEVEEATHEADTAME